MSTVDYRVLVIFEEEIARYGLAREIRKSGCSTVEVTGSVSAGLSQLRSQEYDVVFCGLHFGAQQDGKHFLDVTSVEFPATAVVMVSNTIESSQSLDLILRGAQYCLRMPVFKSHCEVVLANLRTRSKVDCYDQPLLNAVG